MQNICLSIVIYLFDCSHKGGIFAAFRPAHLFVYHRQCHNVQMIVVDRSAVLFGHGNIQFVSVHDSGDDIVFAV